MPGSYYPMSSMYMESLESQFICKMCLCVRSSVWVVPQSIAGIPVGGYLSAVAEQAGSPCVKRAFRLLSLRISAWIVARLRKPLLRSTFVFVSRPCLRMTAFLVTAFLLLEKIYRRKEACKKRAYREKKNQPFAQTAREKLHRRVELVDDEEDDKHHSNDDARVRKKAPDTLFVLHISQILPAEAE